MQALTGPLAPILDLNDLLRGTLGRCMSLLSGNIQLQTALAEYLDPIRAHQAEVEQVLIHLAMNARDAMPDGGTLRVSTQNVPAAPGHAGLGDSPCVLLCVRDTSSGMDPRARATSLSMSGAMPCVSDPSACVVSDGMLPQGARLLVDCVPGEGTTMRVYFPRAIDSASASESGVHLATRVMPSPGAPARSTPAPTIDSLTDRAAELADAVAHSADGSAVRRELTHCLLVTRNACQRLTGLEPLDAPWVNLILESLERALLLAPAGKAGVVADADAGLSDGT
jgi:hypothetical protein